MGDSMNGSMPFERMHAPTKKELHAVFSGYNFLNLIAVGTVGAVYKAVQKSQNREVAIKIFPRRYSRNEAFVKAFNKEAELQSKLDHARLVKVFDFGVVDEMLYIVMEYIEGETLLDFVKRGELNSTATARIAYEISDGLTHAHKGGVIHGNLQPRKVLVLPDHGVKVVDFGIRRLAGFEAQTENVVSGTPGYMAPEMSAQPDLIDDRSDLFALGAIICYCSTGYTPDILMKEGVSKKGLLEDLYPIVFKLLRSKRENRYQSAKAISSRLKSFIAKREGKRSSFDFELVDKDRKRLLFPMADHRSDISSDVIRETLKFELGKSDGEIVFGERYVLRNCLATRRLGVLYRAYDKKLERDVAITLIFMKNSFTWRDEFLNIIGNLAQFEHPNIPSMVDAGVYSKGAYYVQQLIEGETLFKMMKKARLTYIQVYELCLQVLEALKAGAHYGFLNYGICPQSIIARDRAVMGKRYIVTDTGHGKIAELLRQYAGQTVVETVVDSALMPPELFEGNPAGEKSAIYMIGQLMYYLLASGHPYAFKPPAEAYQLHKAGKLPSITEYRKSVPAEFSEWIEKCIQVNPAERFNSLDDAMQSLPDSPQGANA